MDSSARPVSPLRQRMLDDLRMRVEQGKGRKDRYAMLSPVLLERLRVSMHTLCRPSPCFQFQPVTTRHAFTPNSYS